jgi:DNA-binding NarL/FixJ family response regulator
LKSGCHRAANQAGTQSHRFLERPAPGRLLAEVDPAALAGHWRGALGRDLPGSQASGDSAVGVWATSISSDAHAPEGSGPTPREREVLGVVAGHYTNREVAEELVLRIRTVERHVANIYAKLGVSSRRLATADAREHGVLADDDGRKI